MTSHLTDLCPSQVGKPMLLIKSENLNREAENILRYHHRLYHYFLVLLLLFRIIKKHERPDFGRIIDIMRICLAMFVADSIR